MRKINKQKILFIMPIVHQALNKKTHKHTSSTTATTKVNK